MNRFKKIKKIKKIKFICFILALMFIFTSVVLLLSSCKSKTEKEWDLLKDSGSLEEFLEFSQNLEVKESEFSDELNRKIQDKIKKEENSELLIALLNKYPEWEDEFKDRISEIALNLTLSENTVDALEKYIDAFSDYGKNTDYINKAAEVLKNLYFDIAREQKSIELLEDFILRYKDYDDIMAKEAQRFINELNDESDWGDALKKYEAENSLLPLIDFIDSRPDSIFIPDAKQLLKEIRNDSLVSEKYLAEPNLDSIEEFLVNFPGHKDFRTALSMREDFVGDIYSMIKKEYLSVVSIGDSISRNRIIIQNRVNSRLLITIPFGTYLAANSGSIQNMLIREEKTLSVAPEQHGSLYINTVCMNIYKDVPDDTNYFNIDILKKDSPVIKLLKILDENNSLYEVAQAAVWHIMDNPGKEIILSTLVYDDGASAITEELYNEAMRLVELIYDEYDE